MGYKKVINERQEEMGEDNNSFGGYQPTEDNRQDSRIHMPVRLSMDRTTRTMVSQTASMDRTTRTMVSQTASMDRIMVSKVDSMIRIMVSQAASMDRIMASQVDSTDRDMVSMVRATDSREIHTDRIMLTRT